jgi:hypothetical protein
MNCKDNTDEEQGVKYGEALRASLPRRVKEITVRQADTRTAHSLFQVVGSLGVDRVRTQAPKPPVQDNAKTLYEQDPTAQNAVDLNKVISRDLAQSVHDLQVAGNSPSNSRPSQRSGGKERVSFDTKMSTDEECSDGGSVEQKAQELMSIVERFHARKFKATMRARADKRAVLKVTGSSSSKKQKKPRDGKREGSSEGHGLPER